MISAIRRTPSVDLSGRFLLGQFRSVTTTWFGWASLKRALKVLSLMQ